MSVLPEQTCPLPSQPLSHSHWGGPSSKGWTHWAWVSHATPLQFPSAERKGQHEKTASISFNCRDGDSMMHGSMVEKLFFLFTVHL